MSEHVWPERMKQETAAKYLDMCTRTFRRKVTVEKVAGGYLKADLDRWLQQQKGRRGKAA